MSELLAAVQAGEMTDTVRLSLARVLHQLMEAELTATIGAAPGQRSETRTAQRNGHHSKLLSTAAGDIEVGGPKLRTPLGGDRRRTRPPREIGRPWAWDHAITLPAALTTRWRVVGPSVAR